MPNTTPIPDGDLDTSNDGNQENWEQRYTGLQRAYAKRDAEREAELTARQVALDNLAAEREADTAALAEYRQRDLDASQAAADEQEYERLKAIFEPAPPAPIGINPPRVLDWMDAPSRATPAKLDDVMENSGWPI